jgi:hypothetical protein
LGAASRHCGAQPVWPRRASRRRVASEKRLKEGFFFFLTRLHTFAGHGDPLQTYKSFLVLFFQKRTCLLP